MTKLPGFTVLSASSVHVLPSYQHQQGAVFFLYSTKSGRFHGWLTAPIAATEERSPRAIVVVVGIVHSPLGIFPHEPTYEMEVETLYDENLKWTMRDKDRLLL
ncbi:hypothetical protein L1049_006764 [Liquidambar formosana]|uniref:Uncharacterized protein n=1 Tax=Liquidambar formosana TaxID=63359 RepID=A0AAP0WUL0_LIQFO